MERSFVMTIPILVWCLIIFFFFIFKVSSWKFSHLTVVWFVDVSLVLKKFSYYMESAGNILYQKKSLNMFSMFSGCLPFCSVLFIAAII